MWHDSYVCDTPLYVWHDSCVWDMPYMCVTWLTRVWHVSCGRYDLNICDMTRLTQVHSSYMWDMPHMCVVTWLTCAWHASRVRYDLHICDIIYVWHHIYVIWLVDCKRTAHMCLIRSISMWYASYVCDMTHMCITRLVCVWHTSRARHVRLFNRSFLTDMRLFCGSVLTLRERVWHSSRARYDLNTCDMTRLPQAQSSCVCDVLRMCVARLTYAWHDSHVRDMSCMCVTWLARAWHASCVRHDLNTYMHVSVHMTHVEYIYALWLHIIHICTMTWIHICMSYGVATIHLVYRKRTAHTVHLFRRCLYVTWLICVWYAPYVCDMSHMCVTWFTCMCWWLMSHMRWWLIRETSYMGYDSQDYI